MYIPCTGQTLWANLSSNDNFEKSSGSAICPKGEEAEELLTLPLSQPSRLKTFFLNCRLCYSQSN